MKQFMATCLLATLVALFFTVPVAAAGSAFPACASTATVIEPGRSPVPTAPLISFQEQQGLAANWSSSGSQAAAGTSSSAASSYGGTLSLYYATAPCGGSSSGSCATVSGGGSSSGSCATVFGGGSSSGSCATASGGGSASGSCATASGGGSSTVEPGRSPVPTAPLISWQEQRKLASSWPQTGSLVPGGDTAQAPESPVPQEPSEPSGEDAQQPTPPEASTPDDTDDGHYTPGLLTSQEQALYEAINQERAAQGIAPLPLDLELSALAREKSADMVGNGYFAHESPTYGSAGDMLDSAGYDYTSVGENIARSSSVEKGHVALMSSQNHRRNILGSQWQRVGVGVVNDANGYPYITELFVR